MQQRILGFDFARGLAIIGMVFVNFKVVMSYTTSGWLYDIMELLSGKAAALFVVLAGIGMTLMFQSAKRKNDATKLKQVKLVILKRAAFLFVVGLSYYTVWPADILHYYGVYLTIGVFMLGTKRKKLLVISLSLLIAYFMLVVLFEYEKGWNWENMEYSDFFTFAGFFRNLFFNGFHPVIPWLVFLLIGIWVGRIDFNDADTRKLVLVISINIYAVCKLISLIAIYCFSSIVPNQAEELNYLLGTSPMPPMFFYVVTTSSLAVAIITLSIYLTQYLGETLFVKQMVSAGQLALSNYFFHVIIGMLGIYLIFGKLEQAFSIEFTVAYASLFNLLILVFSYYWKARFNRGPLELIMRKITG